MSLIQRYLFRQLLGPTLAAAGALVGIAILSTSLSQLQLIVEYGQSAAVFGKVTALALPGLISLVLPIAVFVAALVTLNRLHSEQEIVVCFSSGMSRWSVISPVLRLATLAALLVLVLNLFVTPWAQRESRQQIFSIRTDLAATLVREGEYNSPAPGLTVYAQRVERDGRMLNVFIHEERGPKGPRTFTAREGRMVTRAAGPAMVLNDGSSEEYDEFGVLTFLVFDENVFDLKPFVNTTDRLFYKNSDKFMHELVSPALAHDQTEENRNRTLAEANARVAAPLYTLSFVMLALSAVIGGQFSRLGYARRIIYAAAIAGAARVIAFGAQAAAGDSPALNIVQYLIPVGIAYLAYADMFRRKASGEISRRRGRGPMPLGLPTALVKARA